jgi:predicted secreted protein
MELGEAEIDSTHQVTRGEEIVIRLPENRTTAYQWFVEISDPAVVHLTDDTFQPGGDAPGAGGIRTLTLVGQSTGSATLRLVKRRPWESAPAQGSPWHNLTVQVS